MISYVCAAPHGSRTVGTVFLNGDRKSAWTEANQFEGDCQEIEYRQPVDKTLISAAFSHEAIAGRVAEAGYLIIPLTLDCLN